MTGQRPATPAQVRTAALVLLWLALAAQLAWTFLYASRDAATLTRPGVFTVAFLLVALTGGRVGWIALIGRLVVGAAFLTALLPRFTDFERFVRYTARVNSFLPGDVIPTVAVVATACECVLCVCMLLGIKTRWAAAGSALLLCLFATAMTISGLSQAEWAVYVLSAGAFTLATTDASLLSVDRLVAMAGARRRPSVPGAIPS